MATRTPLVIVAGQIQQLQSGDTLSASVAAQDALTLTNGEASTAMIVGNAVYVSGADTVKLAKANAMSTAAVIGLANAAIATSATGQIILGGVIALTTAQWDAVAGTSGGLSAGAVYYLDPSNFGKITATAPSTVGQVVTAVGVGISTTELQIDATKPILL